jgi:hypothetical protein
LWQKILQDSSFFLSLLQFDRDLAEQCRHAGCGCGGRLHSARYGRKPRGGPADLPDEYDRRESFCCAEEGCRRRITPPSLRFLGRRVYLGAVVVLVSAMVQGVTAKRAAAIRELVGVDRRTLGRWQEWWQESFPRTRLWKAVRARFVPPVEVSKLPASLLERFGEPTKPGPLLAVLRLLAPLSAGSNCVVGL